VTIKGRVGALIELGAGFNPIMSGRENIYNNGAVLGFTRQEIESKVEEIIDFSEIREFIDMPVQNYSSGMKVRLGFAVAAQMEPDILIIDEVLAVGDVSFRAKCYERIAELMKTCCVILVSHSMSQISKVCTKALLLHKGTIAEQGYTGNVIEAYFDDNFVSDKESVIYSRNCNLLYFNTVNNNLNGKVNDFKVEIGIHSEVNMENIELNFVLMSRELIPICQSSSKFMKQNISIKKGDNKFTCTIDSLYLNTGIYKFSFTVDSSITGQKYLWVQNLNPIQVINDFTGVSPVILESNWKRND
jgi:lipopolysaccharide transport system ATP-binding protein